MTDAEKAEAAKAEAAKSEAAKKAADEAEKAKADATKTPPADDTKDKESENARIKELNEESKKHRLEAKALKEENARYKKAFEIIQGKEAQPDPAELQKKQTDDRVRKAYLKSAFVSVAAKDMHDAEFAFDAVAAEFSDVTVDLDSGRVDKESIRGKLGDLKKARPFLFVQEQQTNGNGTKPPPRSPPDGSGNPGNGGDVYKQWISLKQAPGRAKEAQEFYEKNRASIYANWPK